MPEKPSDFYKEIAEMLEKKESAVIRAKTLEGKEIVFEMEKIREHWVNFYKEHGLNEMAEDLPKEITLSPEQIKRIQELAETQGFNRFLLLPENPDQYLNQIKKATEQELPGLPDKKQYSVEGTWFSDPVNPNFPDKIQTLNRPKGRDYLVFLKDSPEVDSETLNKSAETLRQKFQEKGLQGLTLTEYLLFQRDYTTGHISENEPHPDINYHTYLLDSEIPSGRVLMTDWVPDNGLVRVYSNTPDIGSDILGCRSSAVLEL